MKTKNTDCSLRYMTTDVLYFQKHGLDKLLASHGYFNLLAPVNGALNRLQPQSRKVIILAKSIHRVNKEIIY